jgi:PAS domain-containing protein
MDRPLKAAEEALRDSEAHFRELADHMSQMAWTADASGRTPDPYVPPTVRK